MYDHFDLFVCEYVCVRVCVKSVKLISRFFLKFIDIQ